MVTYLTTNPSVSYLDRAKRTGSLVVSAIVNLIFLKLTVYRRQRKTVQGTAVSCELVTLVNKPIDLKRAN